MGSSQVKGVDATIKALKNVDRSLKNAIPVVSMARNLRRAIQKKVTQEGRGR